MTRRILLTNVTLAGRSGTEIVTRDLAIGLARRGHAVSVYAPTLGPIAETIRAAGVAVSARLADLPAPELIQGHHFVQTMEAIDAFPTAHAVFVCHDRTAAHSIPPRHPRVRAYAAVDLNCLERLEFDWTIPSSFIRMIRNAVDLDRFAVRGPLPATPKRALVFSHYAEPGAYVDLLRDACASLRIDVEVVGAGIGHELAEPERVLGSYDIVFAKARCAIEAAVAGATVVVCAPAGLGELLTRAQAPALYDWNLGARVLREPLTAAGLRREIARYAPDDAARVTQFFRDHASLESAISNYESLYESVLDQSTGDPRPARDLAWVGPLLNRIQSLETHVGKLQLGNRMPPLSDDDISHLAVTIEDAPDRMTPGEAGFVRAAVQNGTSERVLGTWPPFPVNWSYRWLLPDGTELPVEGVRTPIQPPIPPKSSGEAMIQVEAPREPGDYVLRITLVQETLRWLDRPPASIRADTAVAVRFPNGLTIP